MKKALNHSLGLLKKVKAYRYSLPISFEYCIEMYTKRTDSYICLSRIIAPSLCYVKYYIILFKEIQGGIYPLSLGGFFEHLLGVGGFAFAGEEQAEVFAALGEIADWEQGFMIS